MTTIHLSNGTIHIHITGVEGLTETSGLANDRMTGTEHKTTEVAAPWVTDVDYEAFLNSYE